MAGVGVGAEVLSSVIRTAREGVGGRQRCHWISSPSLPLPSARPLFKQQASRFQLLRYPVVSLCAAGNPSPPPTSPATSSSPTRLYVSGLSFRTTEESSRNAFEMFGQLTEVNLVMDKIANRPRGFAFLRYATEEEARKAIDGMHGKAIAISRTGEIFILRTVSDVTSQPCPAVTSQPFPVVTSQPCPVVTGRFIDIKGSFIFPNAHKSFFFSIRQPFTPNRSVTPRLEWLVTIRKMDEETRSARHRRRLAVREEQPPHNVYRRTRVRPKKSKNNDDEAGPSTSRDPPLDNTDMEDPPLYQNISNVDPTWHYSPGAQQESDWYVPPASAQTSDWPMRSGGMGVQPCWPSQQPNVEEAAQEQAHQAHPTGSRPRGRGRDAIVPKLVAPVPGGPVIPDLLYSFTAHTAYFIYQGIERPTLTFQLRQEQLRKWKLDDEHEWCDLTSHSGLTHLQDLMYNYVDQPLISAFLERWQPETNSFHMPFGEMTITLLDVYMILGLHIEGRGMGHTIEDRVKGKNELYNEQAQKAIRFFSLNAGMARDGVSADALKTHCETMEDLENEKIASGYLWYLMASTLFPDKSQHMLPMPYLTCVSEIDNISNLSWGSGALAYMYRSLGECTRHECRQMSTCYTLLMAWIYQYFPVFRPQENAYFHNDVPYASRWQPVATRNRHRRNYREELDLMQAMHVDWQPYGYVDYDQPQLAPAFFHGVISFLKITEPYMPDRVSRQFGVAQGIPRPVIEPVKAHRGTTLRKYIVQYDPSSSWSWEARRQHSILPGQMGPPAPQGYECSADYMEWYIPRTHPCVRPEVAGIRDPVQVIGQALHRLNPFYNAEEEQFYNMRTAVRECIQDFRQYEHGNVGEEEDDD